jgi:alpha-galactosidase
MTHPIPLRPFSVVRGDGVMVVLQHDGVEPATVLHWGADLGDLDDDLLQTLSDLGSRLTPPQRTESALRPPVVPQESEAWTGRPGLAARRDGVQLFPRWTVRSADGGDERSPRRVSVTLDDTTIGVVVQLSIAIEEGGLVAVDLDATNTGPGTLDIDWLEAVLPVPKAADHLTTFSGRWTREKRPFTTDVPRGSVLRQTRRGRSGHDATNLFVASAGAPRNEEGRAWAVHLGWSADTSYRLDRLPDAGMLIGAGELLRGGEIRLDPGEAYATPTAYFAWSDQGLDGLSARFHAFLRSRPTHPAAPRPLVLNTWEAVYFDQDPATLSRLADVAAAVGVERFVLDDGWFHSRRDDTAGLGDWVVDTDVWPDGLVPLADHVRSLGMDFGLWFEPEMVNLDSDLARAHPEWLLHEDRALVAPPGLSWRDQYSLDLANPDAFEHVFHQMDAVIGELGVAFVKWDHNRDMVDAVHAGRPGLHQQTRAAHTLMDRLRAAHPGLEIESCASGGARSDLGIIAHTDRVWASDSNDPVERQDIQRWTQMLLPPELIGGHVGPAFAHSSGRHTSLSYRLATSLMGSAGFEWNLLECTPDEIDRITRWARTYKAVRHVIAGGRVVHPDVADPALRVTGFVLPDRSEALFSIATVASLEDSLPEPLRLAGLDPQRRYRVAVVPEASEMRAGLALPRWLSAGQVTTTGAALGEVGLQMPALWPAQAIVLHVTAA